jgi:hypothetical protein
MGGTIRKVLYQKLHESGGIPGHLFEEKHISNLVSLTRDNLVLYLYVEVARSSGEAIHMDAKQKQY